MSAHDPAICDGSAKVLDNDRVVAYTVAMTEREIDDAEERARIKDRIRSLVADYSHGNAAAFAVRLGLNEKKVQRWCSDKSADVPKLADAIRIRIATGRSLDWLIGRDLPQPRISAAVDHAADEVDIIRIGLERLLAELQAARADASRLSDSEMGAAEAARIARERAVPDDARKVAGDDG